MKTLINIPTKMKALVLHNVGDLRYEEVNVPTLTDGTVLLKIKACGICSSDIPRIFVNGTYHFPTIPGHEFSGQIVAIGDNVDENLLGKRACAFPMLPCRKCKACEIEQWAQCSGYSYFGSRCDGAFAEYLVVPTWNLVPFSDSLSYEEAALCEPAAVSLHAINIADLKDGQNVMITGTGTIGFLIGTFAKTKIGNGKVIVCGRSENKLEYAKKLGFETINLNTESLSEDIQKIVGSNAVDVTFEAVGANSSIETAIKSTGAFGKVILVGNPTDDLHIEKNAYWSILRKQMTLAGSWNSNFNSKINDWQDALKIFESGSLNLKGLITHTFPISESEKAFETLKSKDVFTLKVMFTFD
ncbi:MAG: galactitol-1-phosphate 5-dehydrogenase [Ruminococcus sp.]|nr:galactitol-1-phosphate 5-dehydrogenase [Ruminococcus sp.]MCD7800836.1 galactitol-1-phosphate 5-dehydrogenase [Ruminococcus sp.]